MDIGALNERITIQKETHAADSIGNHISAWDDYFSCACTVSEESGTEKDEGGTTNEDNKTAFTVRWCTETARVTSKEYRIIFRNEAYDISFIHHQNYKKRSLKFVCRKVKDYGKDSKGRQNG